MARVNIEDCWWTDPRRNALSKIIGDEEKADGIALKAWRVSQEFWKKDRKPVPKLTFGLLAFASALLQVGLAEEREDGIYVKGSQEYHEWIHERREAGRKGGVASGTSRKPRSNKNAYLTEANAKQNEANASKRKQTQPSSSPSGSISGSSDFFEISKNNSVEKENGTQTFIAKFCEEFKFKYGTNPLIGGKGSGIAKRVVKDYGVKRACELIPTYFAMNDPQFLQSRHDLVLFEMKLNTIVVAHDTGQVITRTEAHQVDKRQANFNAFAQAEERIEERRRNGQ